ncbi:LysR family transcriptional regulator [Neorhizobium sp. CSC1952]|uniref:winged helix-turn-helix domain-containing protein n=1 Tax=Neorhizobium sp. CSC1952 TaxID=2978974 RepID=UPI0025A5033D|nr:LysR family transcriptional regulator [Rhizobium sp. CSC1952]WJR65169.1 LysR family transcriptional regulator [Rhizobium sp. CSC1952]
MLAEVQINVLLKPGLAIGPDTIGLLSAIADTGSITAAARASSISYKKAWHMIDRLNTSFKKPLVSTTKGGDRRGGAILTDMGAEVMTLYRAILTAAASRPKELQKLLALAA